MMLKNSGCEMMVYWNNLRGRQLPRPHPKNLYGLLFIGLTSAWYFGSSGYESRRWSPDMNVRCEYIK